MGRKSKEEEQRVRSLVLSFIKENVDEDGYLKMSASALSLDRGIPAWSIRTALKNLADEGRVEFTETNDVTDSNGRNNRGLIVRLVTTTPMVVPVKEERPIRVCEKCGAVGANADARFCWKCGASLLTEKELLKEAYDRVLPKIAKLGTDSTEMNEIMTVIGKVANMAFKEVVA